MGKDKIYENYRIMSLDGSVIYKSERANSKADKLSAVKGTQLDKEKFGGVLFKNLDTDKLETLICDYEKKNSEEFLVGDYLRAIVNVSFKHTVKEFEPNGGVYIRLGYSETDADIEDGVCIREIDGVKTLIAIDVWRRIEHPIDPELLGKCFTYDALRKTYTVVNERMTTIANLKQIRESLYRDGFYIDNVHYVRYKRSAGASREGKCLFIAEPFYKEMMRWSACGITDEQVNDQASWQAYIALTMSAIENRIKLPKKAIMIIPDKSSVFEDTAVCVKEDAKEGLIASEEKTFIENKIWDGESLLDTSVFKENGFGEKGMLLLRNRFFKTCAFNTHLQKWFADNGITQIRQLAGYTTARNISDIKLVITESSLKYLKFMSKGTSYKDGFKLWIDNLYEGKDTSTFGIVKTDKPPSFMDGAMTYTSYQFLNTIPIAYEDMERFLCPSIDFLQKIQEDSMFLRYKINYLRETDLEDLRVLNADNYRRKTVMDMLFKTPRFERTEFYSNLREDVCKYFKKRLKRGEVMVSGNYEVLFGNPYEFLVATINKSYQPTEPLLLSDGEVYTCRFKDGEELLGVRSPHITMGNLYVVRNKHCKEIDEYFDLTNEIVCVNAIKSNIQHRLNGCDYDSDTILITNNPWLLNGAKICYEQLGVPVCSVEPKGKAEYENTPESLTLLDSKIAKNKIGEIVNLSQFINSAFWDEIMRGTHIKDLLPMYYDICKLAVLSGMEIDKAKRMYSVDSNKVLRLLKEYRDDFKKKNGGKLPNFYNYITGNSLTKDESNKSNLKSPMSYVHDIVDNMKSHVPSVNKIPLTELFDLEPGKDDGNDSRRKRKIIDTVVYTHDMLSVNRITDDMSDGERVAVSEMRKQLFDDCLETVSRNAVNDHVLYMLLRELDGIGNFPSKVSSAKSLLFACLLYESRGRLLSRIKTSEGYQYTELNVYMGADGDRDKYTIDYIYGYAHTIKVNGGKSVGKPFKIVHYDNKAQFYDADGNLIPKRYTRFKN